MIGWIIAACFAALLIICMIRAALAPIVRAASLDVSAEDVSRSEAYAAELTQMLDIETVSSKQNADKAKFYALHTQMAALFPNLHRICEKYDFDGSLLFVWRGTNPSAQPVLLMNHMDVVEADANAWATPPFSGVIKDGRLYGRGVLDDKGPLYAMLRASEELMAAGYTPPCDVYFASSCTEETGGAGAPDTAAFLAARGIQFRFILDEGSLIADTPIKGIKGAFAMVGVTEKAQGDVKFTAHSKGGHASTPGKNTPLVRLGRFMADVDKHCPFRKDYPPFLLQIIRVIGRSLPFPVRILTENIWLFRPFLPLLTERIPALAAMTRTTAAFTTAKGSNGFNVLPQEAYVTANIRYAPHEPCEVANEQLRRRAARFDVEMTVINEGFPIPVTDYTQEAFCLVSKAIRESCGNIVTMPYLVTAATDSRYYTALSNQILRFVPLRVNASQLASVHGQNENLDVKALAGAVDFYKKLIENL